MAAVVAGVPGPAAASCAAAGGSAFALGTAYFLEQPLRPSAKSKTHNALCLLVVMIIMLVPEVSALFVLRPCAKKESRADPGPASVPPAFLHSLFEFLFMA